ncbi:MAG: dihydroneopterin aldolase [Flavobacteriales bacterium]|nr:dihydroneopterin aldolase [Flavobacteriales bacterium]
MGIIRVNGISLFAYHGCLPEEAEIGAHYVVDVSIQTDFQKAADEDNLSKTIDYVALNAIVREEMALRAKLIETVALRILRSMKAEFPQAEKYWVRIAKKSAPMPGHAHSVSVEMELN